jgi:hypothetical protein
VFLLDHGQVMAEHRAATAADRPDYLEIARRGCAVLDHLIIPSNLSNAGARHSA